MPLYSRVRSQMAAPAIPAATAARLFSDRSTAPILPTIRRGWRRSWRRLALPKTIQGAASMRAILMAMAISLAAGPALAAPADPATAAGAWAKLVDQGRYGQSWTEAGTLFRAGVT